MYSQNNITNLCVSKIKDNFINNIVCASLSYKPDYRYYWIRDSALVYRCLIDIYSKNGDICNISLEDFVTNSNDLNPIVEYQNELVQKSNPIYLTPTKGFFDAHFYSPTKNFFGIQISTFVANSMVIWLMILLLSVLLFFDGLRKVIEFSSQKSSELGLRLVRRMKN